MFPTTGRTHIISSLLTGILATECLGGGKRKKKKRTLIQASLLSCVITYIGKSSTVRIRSRRKRLEAAVVIAEGVEVGELIYNTSVYYAVHLHLLNVFSYEWKWIRLDVRLLFVCSRYKKRRKKKNKKAMRERKTKECDRKIQLRSNRPVSSHL